MTKNTEAFDTWIRCSFVEMNTELENRYFEQDDRSVTAGVGDKIKTQIRNEGHDHIIRLGAEGNTDAGFMSAFDLLGNLGFYFASLRRHGLTNPDTETKSPFEEASALGLHLKESGFTAMFQNPKNQPNDTCDATKQPNDPQTTSNFVPVLQNQLGKDTTYGNQKAIWGMSA